MYTIKEAALRTELSIPVLRAWQRRYEIVSPQRTAARYRLYSDEDIARLRAMRRLVVDGWSPSAAAKAVKSAPAERAPGVTQALPADSAVVVDRFISAAAAMDSAGLESTLDEMWSAGSFEEVAERHVLPALVALGEAWARGEVDVAAEHAASHAVLRRLAAAFEAAGAAVSNARPVLVGLPSAARHELGALAFAVTLRRSGVPVTYLGADLPPADWLEAVRHTNARAAVIAVPTESDREAAANVAEALRATAPELVVATGGRGADRSSDAGILVLPDELRAAARELRLEMGER